MGLFISRCPKCDNTIEWFGNVPKKCKKCGIPVTEQEMIDSMFKPAREEPTKSDDKPE